MKISKQEKIITGVTAFVTLLIILIIGTKLFDTISIVGSDVNICAYMKLDTPKDPQSSYNNAKISITGTVDGVNSNTISMSEYGYTITAELSESQVSGIVAGKIIVLQGTIKDINNSTLDIGNIQSVTTSTQDALNNTVLTINGNVIRVDVPKGQYTNLEKATIQAKAEQDKEEKQKEDDEEKARAEKIDNTAEEQTQTDAEQQKQTDQQSQDNTAKIMASAALSVNIDTLLTDYNNSDNEVAYETRYSNKHIKLTAYVKSIGIDGDTITLHLDDQTLSSTFGTKVEFANSDTVQEAVSNLKDGDKVTVDGIGDTSNPTFYMTNCVSVTKVDGTSTNSSDTFNAQYDVSYTLTNMLTTTQNDKNTGLQVTDILGVSNGTIGKITGLVKNNSKKMYSYVTIDFNIYDKSGEQIDSRSDFINNLEPGGTWKIDIGLIDNNAVSYKFVDLLTQ